MTFPTVSRQVICSLSVLCLLAFRASAADLPGPYADDFAAAVAGVQPGQLYSLPDGSLKVWTASSVAKVALWGDSITNDTSTYGCFAVVGRPHALQYEMRPEVEHPELYSVTHSNPGGTGPLTVTMEGHALIVTLGRVGGVPTSTLSEVHDAVLAAYGSLFLVNYFGGDPSTESAGPSAETFFYPYSRLSPNATFVWLQTMMKQRFSLTRRLHNSFQGPTGNPVGDWDFGYSGQTAAALRENPGPTGDVLTADADLVIGCAGTNDLIRGATASQTVVNITGLWDRLDAAGRRYVWMEVPPSGTSEIQAKIETANASLRQLAAARKILLLPWSGSFVQDGRATASYFPDTVHPSNRACQEEAWLLYPLLDRLIQPTPPAYGNPDANWITVNSSMSGDANGVAPGWTNEQPSLTTASKESTGVGNDWQKLTVSQHGLYNDTSFRTAYTTSGWAEGDLVEGVAEISCDTTQPWDVKGLSISVYFRSTDGELTGMKTYKGKADFLPIRPFDGVLRTPSAAIPHGTSSISLVVNCNGSGTFKIRGAGVRKAVYPVPATAGGPPDDPEGGTVFTPLSFQAGCAGTFTGLVYASGDEAADFGQARGGFDSFRLNANGTFTARGNVDGVAFSMKGLLPSDGVYQGSVALGKNDPVPVRISLYRASDGSLHLWGDLTLTSGPLNIDLARTSRLSLPPEMTGAFTLSIPAGDTGSGAPTMGSGVGSLVIRPDGSLTLLYILGDGTRGTHSSALNSSTIWQFYFPPYGQAKSGIIQGRIAFRDIPRVSDLDGKISWTRAAKSGSAVFPKGFSVVRQVVGSKYTVPLEGFSALPNRKPGQNNVEMVAQYASGGPPATEFSLTWRDDDRPKANGPGVQLNVDRTTGIIRGSYSTKNPGAQETLSAVILQKQGLATGLVKSYKGTAPLSIQPYSSR